MASKKVTKAILTAAGYGTRFLPATKNIPKELMPIINMPTLQFLVDECVDSGVRDIIIVTKHGNSAIEDYFDSSPELERYLRDNGKSEMADRIKEIYTAANFVYVRQNKTLPYGNGSPLLAAKPLIDDDEAFIYAYGDDIVFDEPPAMKELIDCFAMNGSAAVLGVKNVDLKTVSPGAMVKLKKNSKDVVERIIEKPPINKAPSNLQSIGRYLFTYKIFDYVDPDKTGKGNELWTADAIDRLSQKEKVVVKELSGTWCTTGDPVHYLEALFEYVMRNGELKDAMEKLVKKWAKK